MVLKQTLILGKSKQISECYCNLWYDVKNEIRSVRQIVSFQSDMDTLVLQNSNEERPIVQLVRYPSPTGIKTDGITDNFGIGLGIGLLDRDNEAMNFCSGLMHQTYFRFFA